MAPNVLQVTREELEERKGQLLRSVGMTQEELTERAATYSLTGSQYEVLSRLEDIDFLLAER